MVNKKFMTILLGLMIVTGSFAMLVSYLSNTSTVEVEVESPISLTQLNELPEETYGGDTLNLSYIETNENINTAIEGFVEVTISRDDGADMELGEFTNFVITEYESRYLDGELIGEFITDCNETRVAKESIDVLSALVLSPDLKTVTFRTSTSLLEGQTCVAFDGALTLSPAVLGTYNIVTQVMVE